MDTIGHCFPKSIIIQAVYFKLRISLSYRDVEEILRTEEERRAHDRRE
jgi:putative transposase